MGKNKPKKVSQEISKNVPLGQQIEGDLVVRPKGRVKIRDEVHVKDDNIVGERLTKKILSSARKQQKELEDEYGVSEFPPIQGEDDIDNGMKELEGMSGHDEDGQRFMDEWKIDKYDEAALETFMRKKEPTANKFNLGAWIAEKIKEKEMQISDHVSEAGGSQRIQKLDPRVESLYKSTRTVLAKYRAGKLPKAFKIIPSLTNWEQVLYLTDPDSWSAAAMFQAVRIFASNSNEKMAQRFYNLILLPRVRDDIETYKRLNFHLYQALRKAMFRPGAFFKGIVLPLVEEGDCTLREAVIISSVLAKTSVPMLHSAAAILKIAEMEYSGASSVFLHVLLNKKYALPYRVIDALVVHLIRFEHETRMLPVLWHQTLLVFVENYAADLGSEQRDALLSLIRVQTHWKMTDVIRKILMTTKPRDVEEADFVPQEVE